MSLGLRPRDDRVRCAQSICHPERSEGPLLERGQMNASDLAPTYDLAVIGGGPAGLAAASLAARAGLSTVLLDENPGVGGQIYRAITSTPVTDRAILGEDYWAGAELAPPTQNHGPLIVARATVWSPEPHRTRRVSLA